jgi:hypothetical protein
MVVSDAAWFEPNPPEELVQWWEKEGYPVQKISSKSS